MIVKENATEEIRLMAELEDERGQEGADILLSGVLEIKKEVSNVS